MSKLCWRLNTTLAFWVHDIALCLFLWWEALALLRSNNKGSYWIHREARHLFLIVDSLFMFAVIVLWCVRGVPGWSWMWVFIPDQPSFQLHSWFLRSSAKRYEATLTFVVTDGLSTVETLAGGVQNMVEMLNKVCVFHLGHVFFLGFRGFSVE